MVGILQKYFTKEDAFDLELKFHNMDGDLIKNIFLSTKLKDPTIAFILSIFVANLGVGRFYIGDFYKGFLYLITLIGFIIMQFFMTFISFDSPFDAAISGTSFFIMVSIFNFLLKFMLFGIWIYEMIVIKRDCKYKNYDEIINLIRKFK